METLAQKLRTAYKLIAEADTTDIGTYWLAVEEAHSYIAEALDMVDNEDRIFTYNDKTKFFIDEHEVSCGEFNDYFDTHDVGWQEEMTLDGMLHLTIFTDDTRS